MLILSLELVCDLSWLSRSMYLAETQNYVWSPGDVEDVCPHTGQDQVDADGDDE